MERRSNTPPTGVFRRLLAVGGVGLILALAIFAASPALHQQLHAAQHASTEDGCAIALFAGGVSVAALLTALPPSVAPWSELRGIAALEVLLDSPRYLLQPERGPPVA